MKVLIPPSEGKTKVKSLDTLFKDTSFRFEREVNQVVRLLELIGDEDLKSVYGTSPEKALMFHRQNQDIFNSPCAPAIERYTGVVYEHIDWNTLSDKAKEYMKKNNLKSNVIFLGNTSQVDEILCSSDLFILPSEKESFGLSALEAMALRVPIISTNVGGLKELGIEHLDMK